MWPSWISQQSLGYPLYMSPQVDYYYPATWLFALFDRPYTLVAANITAITHIFIGALGMWFLLLSRGVTRPLALIFVLAFFFMGGFFSGSQHVDVVRGYAFTPWCFFLVTMAYEPTEKNLFRIGQVLGVALVFSLYFLGAYPGQIISLGAILSIYTALLFMDVVKVEGGKEKAYYSLQVIFLGVLLASFTLVLKYAPFLLSFSEDVARASNAAAIGKANFLPEMLFSFVLDSTGDQWLGNISLRCHFVAAPALVGLLYFSRKSTSLMKNEIILIAIAFVLSAGLLQNLLGEYSSLLGMSRIAVADYKGIIITLVLLVSAVSLQYYKSPSQDAAMFAFLARLSAFSVFYWGGVFAMDLPVRYVEVICYVTTVVAIAIYSLELSWHEKKLWVAFVMFLVATYASVVHLNTNTWRDDSYKKKSNWHMGFDVFESVPDASWLSAREPTRPFRVDLGHKSWFTMRGFYNGEHIIKGYDGSKNLSTHDFLWNKENFLRLTNWSDRIHFFQQEGVACIIPFDSKGENIEKIVSGLIDENGLIENCKQLKQIYYSLQGSSFSMSSDIPLLVVENEMYWDGWVAELDSQEDNSQNQKIRAIKDFKPYRVWRFPAGSYTLTTKFIPDNQIFSHRFAFSLFVFSLSIVIFWSCWWGRNKAAGYWSRIKG